MDRTGFNVYLSFRKYVTRMLETQGEMKVLLLDEETVRMVSLVYSMAEILSKEVFDTSFIFLRGKKNRSYLDAILLIRPTERNIYYLKQELQDPSYKSYKIYFTNSCPPHFLRQLAESDRLQRVQCVFEYYADYCPLGPQLFISNFAQKGGSKKSKEVAITKAPTIQPEYYDVFSKAYANRSVDAIVAAMLSLRVKPYIRHSANNSSRARNLARLVQNRISKMSDCFDRRGGARCMLLIMDRHDDPITPLLQQFSYQAMVHELTARGIRFNRVVMEKKEDEYNKDGKFIRSKETKVEVTMNPMTDMEFFGKHMHEKFMDVIEEFDKATKEVKKINQQVDLLKKSGKISDVQELLTRLPAVKSKERTAKKHSDVLTHLMDKMDEVGLKELSKIQQEIANPALGAGASELFRTVSKAIENNKHTSLDKLKLVMCYALRFEDNRSRIDDLKRKLIDSEARKGEKGLKRPSIDLIDTLLDHMGKSKRIGNCFQKSSIFRMLTGSVDVLQSAPMLLQVMKDLCNGKLSSADYPFMGDRTDNVPDNIIVFYVGGTTYAESRTVAQINTNTTEQNKKPLKYFKGKNIVLGGEKVHRSITFLSYLRALAKLRPAF